MQVAFSPGAEIKFEGANNFRELGGYRASDGRQVKYGLLYRGGNLDLLKSEADWRRWACGRYWTCAVQGRALRTPIRRSRGRTTGASAVCATPTAPR